MTEPFQKRLDLELTERREQGLLRELAVYGEDRLNLISNDYFQLRRHPQVANAAHQATKAYGTGTGASPLLSGYMTCHKHLVEKLCAWKGKPAGMLFNTGFMANQAVIKTLPGKNDLILADKMIHHSVVQSLQQSAAKFKRFHHLDLDHLEELLEKNQKSYETMFVVTETVFSMDGDYPDLNRIVELKRKYPFILILDEAHATGVYGPSGGGLAEEAGILDDVDILVGTLGKSLASMGAYVLTNSSTIIDYLVNFSGEFIYSTFIAPASVGAASCAIDLLKQSAEQRRHLRSLGKDFREELVSHGWTTNSYDSQIVPVIIGNAAKTVDLKNYCQERGILLAAVRPPTVPQGTSRLRVSLHAGAKKEQLMELLELFMKWRGK